MNYTLILNSNNRVDKANTNANDSEYLFDWSVLPEGKYRISYSMSKFESLYLKLNLGQSTAFTTHRSNVKAESTYIVGELNRKFDTNNVIYLRRVPDDNRIKVSIFDKTTDLINTNDIQYIIQLYLEKVED